MHQGRLEWPAAAGYLSSPEAPERGSVAPVKPQALNMLLAVMVTYMMLATALLAPFAWPP
jgi:hypothetical protein